MLLKSRKVTANDDVIDTLDYFVGVIYSLALAKERNFQNRTKTKTDAGVVLKRAEEFGGGRLSERGGWSAGFLFNGALVRISAVYHRALKIVLGKPNTDEHVWKLRPKAETLYTQWTKRTWNNSNIRTVHGEVNTLKHDSGGTRQKRTATYEDALLSVTELLDLIEAWEQHST